MLCSPRLPYCCLYTCSRMLPHCTMLAEFLCRGSFGIIQLQRVVLALQAGCTYPVACSQSVEDRYAQIETDVFVEVITHLLTESPVDGRIVVRTEASVETQLRIITALGDSDTVFASFQTILRSLYRSLAAQCYLEISSGGVRGASSIFTAGSSKRKPSGVSNSISWLRSSNASR